MSIKTILAPLAGDQKDHLVLAAAADIARRNAGHVVAYYADPDPRDISLAALGDGMTGYLSQEIVDALQQQQERRRAAAEDGFNAWRDVTGLASISTPRAADAQAGPSCSFHVAPANSSLTLRDYAMISDCVVSALPDPGPTDRTAIIETALFGAGCPVLCVPSAGVAAIATETPVIMAWNGRLEAGRALSAGLPWFLGGREVVVMFVGNDPPASLELAAAHLAWHGIAARAEIAAAGSAGPAATLLERCSTLGAGLLVMGAYSHSRAREFVFGGVTNHILGHATLPVLLAH